MNSKMFFVKNIADDLPFFQVVKAIKTGQIRWDVQPPLIPAEVGESFARVGYALQLADRIKKGKIHSPLQIAYWSATPYRLGEGAMKFSVIPRCTHPPLDLGSASDLANALREAVASHLANRGALFAFRVQPRTDAQAMPVQDPTVEWDESLSPFQKVATLRLPVRDINSPDRREADERQSFSPWHALEEHQPQPPGLRS